MRDNGRTHRSLAGIGSVRGSGAIFSMILCAPLQHTGALCAIG